MTIPVPRPNHPSHSEAGLVRISRTPFRATNDMTAANKTCVRRAQALSPRFSVSESDPESLIETLRSKEKCLTTRSTARPTMTPIASTITAVLSSCASTVVTLCPSDARYSPDLVLV